MALGHPWIGTQSGVSQLSDRQRTLLVGSVRVLPQRGQMPLVKGVGGLEADTTGATLVKGMMNRENPVKRSRQKRRANSVSSPSAPES